MLISDIPDQIIAQIKSVRKVTIKELVAKLGVSKQTVHKHIKKLIEERKIQKYGSAPNVYYSLIEERIVPPETVDLDSSIKKTLEENYLYVSPLGEMHYGVLGFSYWCQKINQDVCKIAKEYVAFISKYKKQGRINADQKMEKTFYDTIIAHTIYEDFYSIPRFGKTKLGQLILYAKQNQNLTLIQKIVSQVRTSIIEIIEEFDIKAICFVPPTVKRETQFMTEFQRMLRINLPIISTKKIRNDVAVPQKTLNNLPDRIKNAQNTIIIDDMRHFDDILVIDDAVGSGATLHEMAIKLKDKNNAKRVIGYAIVGSFKGFDVITEV